MSGKVRFAVVDDHPMFRAGVIHTLVQAGMESAAEGEAPADAIRIARETAPDVLLIDVNMGTSSIPAVRQIAVDSPAVRTMMLTVVSDEEHVVAALRAGATGYILKGVAGQELVESVRRVSRGEAYVYPALAAALIGHVAAKKAQDPFAMLTVREEQILGYLAKGLSNKEIGSRLDISDKTVKHYLTSVLQKLQVRNRVEAALLAATRLGESGAGWLRSH
jgi:two-component system, NarL family, nitrate/nitrite response regulator NarL